MTAAFWFWLFFVLAVVFRGWFYAPEQRTIQFVGNDLLWYLLIFLLGWQVFGSPIK